jgi:hypothetical protein
LAWACEWLWETGRLGKAAGWLAAGIACALAFAAAAEFASAIVGFVWWTFR